MIFSYSYSKKIDLPPLKFGFELNSRTEDINFLGLYVDERLSFSWHVSTTCLKISKSIGVLYKLSTCLPAHIMKILYYALFYPFLRYSTRSSKRKPLEQYFIYLIITPHTITSEITPSWIFQPFCFEYNKRQKNDYISPKYGRTTRHGINLQLTSHKI